MALAVGGTSAAAQSYPAKPITIVVPAAAGGPTDTVARLMADAMGRTLGQQVLVENIGGAGGTIGMARVAKAPADGYTLAVWHIGQSTAPALYETLKYNVMEDFDSIGRITDVPMTVVGKADLPDQIDRRAHRLDEGEAEGRHLRPRWHRLGLASVRAAAHAHPEDRDDGGGLSRHRAGHERPAGRRSST